MNLSVRPGCRHWILAAASAVALTLSLSGAAWAQPMRSFDIPAQDLAVALEAFAKQADTEVLFDREQTRGKQSIEIKGELDPAAALRALMGGNGLPIRQINDRTFVVGQLSEARETLRLSRADGGTGIAAAGETDETVERG